MKKNALFFAFSTGFILFASSAAAQNHHFNEHYISTYQPTYILPFYYTETPSPIYNGNTPDGQKIQNTEFKFQLSFKAPIIKRIFRKNNAVYLAYTQDSFWQAYSNSPFFRENNYQPEIFLQNKIHWHFFPSFPATRLNFGAVHQSNGRGGTFERSWNRIYAEIVFRHDRFSLGLKGWYIFHDTSYQLHNPDIQRYMGHGTLMLSYHFKAQVLSVETYNNLESGFKRGSIIVNYSFPLLHEIKGFAQFFSGYGQSLIEYNHRTNAFGVGIAI